MSTTEDRTSDARGTASARSVDTILDVIVIPVSDVDRAKEFYGSLGWRLDADRAGEGFRLVQFTPLPGRVARAAASFRSSSDLASAMRRASAAHGEHEKRIGAADPDWPDWYAEYILAEQAGTEVPT
jgi:catechol 2,3-dioxygenase-like lactoylglutathione lyase family enzyme